MSKILKARVYRIESAKLHPVVLELETDEGLVGVGEASISFGIGGLATAAMISEFCQRMILGQDSSQIEETVE